MKEIIEKYLGIREPKITKINIGSQNETYSIDDKYVLKIFNKDTIRNDYEKEIREEKEKIAELANKNGVNAILPYKYNGRYIQKRAVYFSIYPYTKYRAIKRNEVTKEHISELARLVRALHNLNLDVLVATNKKVKLNINMDKYIVFHRENIKMKNLLLKNKEKLELLASRINKALDGLKGKAVISHNDLKFENVLWETFKPYFIDWDAAGYVNHMCAANECAYFWSVNNGELNLEYYTLFMKLYLAKHECTDNIYDVLYASLYEKFTWFVYSLERSTYSDVDEAKKGAEEVISLISEFIAYEKNIPEMSSALNTLDEKYDG